MCMCGGLRAPFRSWFWLSILLRQGLPGTCSFTLGELASDLQSVSSASVSHLTAGVPRLQMQAVIFGLFQRL